jgi:hypothetical protein
MSDTPILLLVFNRPETTRRVLEAIRRIVPTRLYVAADGPRSGHERDAGRCAEVRDLVHRGIDWDCDIQYLERETNLGCRRAVSSAITWFFEKVEEGIILEDDCLPAPQFFPFCSNLLARYQDVPRVAHIGGYNCQLGRKRGEGSYYFSKYFHVWGWASWRRAWNGYDVEMHDYQLFIKSGGLENLFDRRSLRAYWRDIFDATAAGVVNTWDYQWVYRNFKDDRLSVVPNINMIENIGFGKEATHTSSHAGRMPAAASGISQEILHPRFILPCKAADDFTYRSHLKLGAFYDGKHIVKRILGRP